MKMLKTSISGTTDKKHPLEIELAEINPIHLYLLKP